MRYGEVHTEKVEGDGFAQVVLVRMQRVQDAYSKAPKAKGISTTSTFDLRMDTNLNYAPRLLQRLTVVVVGASFMYTTACSSVDAQNAAHEAVYQVHLRNLPAWVTNSTPIYASDFNLNGKPDVYVFDRNKNGKFEPDEIYADVNEDGIIDGPFPEAAATFNHRRLDQIVLELETSLKSLELMDAQLKSGRGK